MPPNGAPRSRTKKQLTHTVPATSGGTDSLGAVGVAGDERRGQAETGVVGHADGLVLGRERLHRQDRAEHLFGQDLAARFGIDQHRRLVVEATELCVRVRRRPTPSRRPPGLD